jgi:hypothetical protein
LILLILGFPAAPEGLIALPFGKALRAPAAGRSNCLAGAAATFKLDKMKANFMIRNKLKT